VLSSSHCLDNGTAAAAAAAAAALRQIKRRAEDSAWPNTGIEKLISIYSNIPCCERGVVNSCTRWPSSAETPFDPSLATIVVLTKVATTIAVRVELPNLAP
jgi:hypothetical protein